MNVKLDTLSPSRYLKFPSLTDPAKSNTAGYGEMDALPLRYFMINTPSEVAEMNRDLSQVIEISVILCMLTVLMALAKESPFRDS